MTCIYHHGCRSGIPTSNVAYESATFATASNVFVAESVLSLPSFETPAAGRSTDGFGSTGTVVEDITIKLRESTLAREFTTAGILREGHHDQHRLLSSYTASVLVQVTVQSTDPSSTYTSLTNALSSAVSMGSFTQVLQANAAIANIATFSGVTTTSVSSSPAQIIAPPTISPTAKAKVAAGGGVETIIVIVVIVAAVILLICCGLAVAFVLGAPMACCICGVSAAATSKVHSQRSESAAPAFTAIDDQQLGYPSGVPQQAGHDQPPPAQAVGLSA